jgi:hypothetical protein
LEQPLTELQEWYGQGDGTGTFSMSNSIYRMEAGSFRGKVPGESAGSAILKVRSTSGKVPDGIQVRAECAPLPVIQSWVIQWTFNCDVNASLTRDVRAECLRFFVVGN